MNTMCCVGYSLTAYVDKPEINSNYKKESRLIQGVENTVIQRNKLQYLACGQLLKQLMSAIQVGNAKGHLSRLFTVYSVVAFQSCMYCGVTETIGDYSNVCVYVYIGIYAVYSAVYGVAIEHA